MIKRLFIITGLLVLALTLLMITETVEAIKAKRIEVETGSLLHNLSGVDEDVQTALETLDDLSIGTNDLNSRYVNISGDTMTGALIVQSSMSGISLTVSGTGSASMIFTKTANNRIGFGTDAPQATIDIQGTGDTGTTHAMVVRKEDSTSASAVRGLYMPVATIDVNNAAQSTYGLYALTRATGSTLSTLYGMAGAVQVLNSTITDVYPMWSYLEIFSGALITNAYNLYLDASIYDGATIDNYYGIYQRQPTAKNYFAGKMGLDTASPANQLTVSGGLSVSSSYTGITSPVNGAIIAGVVGIGTSSPQFKLDVSYGSGAGTVINGKSDVDAGDVSFGVNNAFTDTDSLDETASFNFKFNNITAADMIAGKIGDFTTDAKRQGSLTLRTRSGANMTDALYIDNVGNVGIGTTVPTEKLHVKGSASSFGTLIGVEETDSTLSAGWVYNTGGVARGRITGIKSTGAVNNEGDLVFETRPVSPGELTEQMRILSNGNILMGTATESAEDPRLLIVGDDTEGVVVEMENTVADADTSFSIDNKSVAEGSLDETVSLEFRFNDATAAQMRAIKEEDFMTPGNRSASLAFMTRLNGGAQTEQMRIDSSGNVGIGISTPETKLEVIGTMSGNTLFSGTGITIGDNDGIGCTQIQCDDGNCIFNSITCP